MSTRIGTARQTSHNQIEARLERTSGDRWPWHHANARQPPSRSRARFPCLAGSGRQGRCLPAWYGKTDTDIFVIVARCLLGQWRWLARVQEVMALEKPARVCIGGSFRHGSHEALGDA